MKISGTYTLPLPQEQAYAVMQDPEVLARAIPGCESLEKTGPDEYRMKMKMALASLSGAFEGKVRITEQTPPNSFPSGGRRHRPDRVREGRRAAEVKLRRRRHGSCL